MCALHLQTYFCPPLILLPLHALTPVLTLLLLILCHHHHCAPSVPFGGLGGRDRAVLLRQVAGAQWDGRKPAVPLRLLSPVAAVVVLTLVILVIVIIIIIITKRFAVCVHSNPPPPPRGRCFYYTSFRLGDTEAQTVA